MSSGTAEKSNSELKAKRTLALLSEAMEAGKSLGISQVLQLIQEITSKADTISVSQLAEMVSRDLATMAKVLGVANTIGFNPTGVEVTTVQQAIQTIGFEKIRNIAIALLLLESAELGAIGREKQQVAAHALASGTLAQAIAEEKAGLDPEQVFVCSALRNYGQLLLVNFLPDQYTQARELMAQQNWDAACRSVFGLTCLEIAYEVLSAAQLAKTLLTSLRPVPSELLESKFLAPSEQILVVSEFSNRFCESLSSPTSSTETNTDQMQKLARQYGKALVFESEQLKEILDRTEKRLRSVGQAHGLKAFRCPLIQRLANLAPAAPRPVAPKPVSSTELRARAESEAGGAEGSPSFQRWLARLSSMKELGQGKQSLEELLSGVLDLLHEELGLVESVVFLRDEILPTWSARVGRGELFQSIRAQSLLSEDSRNVFTVCLTRGEDVLIQSPNEPSIRKYVPEWLRPFVCSRPLLLLSLKDSRGTLGVICAVGESQKSVSLTSKLAKPLQILRGLLVDLNRNPLAP